MGYKNDFTIIVFFENEAPKKWTYVHKIDGFGKFLNQKHPTWKYMNVYDRRTAKYLRRFYSGNPLPTFITIQ